MYKSVFIIFLLFFINFNYVLAADQITSSEECVMNDQNECGSGCKKGAYTGTCTLCADGTYSDGFGDCKKCTKPTGAEYDSDASSNKYQGYTADICPWTLTCNNGEFYDTNKSACQSCGSKDTQWAQNAYKAKDENSSCQVKGAGSQTVTNNCSFENICEANIYTLVFNINISEGIRNALESANVNLPDSKTAYYKYNTGFSSDPGAASWDQKNLPQGSLYTDNPLKKFMGYGKNGDCVNEYNRVFDSNGAKKNELPSPSSGKVKMMACWENQAINVIYNYNGSTVNVSCSINTAENGVEEEFKCVAEKINVDDGYYVSGYTCSYEEDGKKVDCGSINVDESIPPYASTITLTAQVTSCQAGYYCSGGEKIACPIGTTSDGGTTSTSEDSCYMTTGNTGTQFCDDSDCFYLPAVTGKEKIHKKIQVKNN